MNLAGEQKKKAVGDSDTNCRWDAGNGSQSLGEDLGRIRNPKKESRLLYRTVEIFQ